MLAWRGHYWNGDCRMLRRINPVVVIAFLLGISTVAVFETLLSFQASKCLPQEQSQKPNTSNDKNGHGSEHGHKTMSEPFACSIGGLPTATRTFMNQNEGFFIGSFTLLLVVVTAWLVWATIKLWRGAEDTAQRQLRAYLFIEDRA
jgi:predicted tellurium resistance membrane protein TerC